jgi:hypothetical protein
MRKQYKMSRYQKGYLAFMMWAGFIAGGIAMGKFFWDQF